jgi:hypothetical protein
MEAPFESRYAITQIGLACFPLLQSLDAEHDWIRCIQPLSNKLLANSWAYLVCLKRGKESPSEKIGTIWELDSLKLQSVDLLNELAP